jgi:hypothetical protein
MSWQAFSWQEITDQARVAQLTGKLQPAIDWTGSASTEALRLVGAFLTPLALTQGALAIWRLGADLGFAGDFFIEDGIFSHWQVWLALAIGTQALAVSLNRWLRSLPEPHRQLSAK